MFFCLSVSLRLSVRHPAMPAPPRVVISDISFLAPAMVPSWHGRPSRPLPPLSLCRLFCHPVKLVCTQPSWGVFLTCSFDRWPVLKSRLSQAGERLGGRSKWVHRDKLQQPGNDPKPCPLGVSLMRFTSFSLSHKRRSKELGAQSTASHLAAPEAPPSDKSSGSLMVSVLPCRFVVTRLGSSFLC